MWHIGKRDPGKACRMNQKSFVLFAASVSIATSLQMFVSTTTQQSLAAPLPSTVAPLSPATSRSQTNDQDHSGATKPTDNNPAPTSSTAPNSKQHRHKYNNRSTPDQRSPDQSGTPPPPPPSSEAPAPVPLIHPVAPPPAPLSAPPAPPAATGVIPVMIPHNQYIHYSPYPVFYRNGRQSSSESDDELKQKLNMTLKSDEAHSALAVEQMCDLEDRYIDTSKVDFALPLIDQITAAYAKLNSDDQHYLAQRLLDEAQRLQQKPGSGPRYQMLVTTVLSALNKDIGSTPTVHCPIFCQIWPTSTRLASICSRLNL